MKANMKIAITGHRPNKLWNDYNLISQPMQNIKKALVELVREHKPTHLISGMALGIDTLWALIAVEHNIPLIAAIPCTNQEKAWPENSKKRYRSILKQIGVQISMITPDEYTPECMQLRNEWMVDNCDLLIAVWDGTKGGTANCVRYASQVGKPMIVLDPNNYL